jgi:DNA mismatch endonuclease (patch repair protein)
MKYIRDGRAPIPQSSSISRVMSANRGRDTGPELKFRKALRALGIRNYRIHLKNVPGRPDVSIPNKKIAIFINGCFWHRCPFCKLPLPKSNTAFWKKKFVNNIKRDRSKTMTLRNAKWKVFVFWECEIERSPERYAKKVKEYLNRNNSN